MAVMIGNRPLSAFRHAFIVVEDHSGEIGIVPLEEGTYPKDPHLLAGILSHASMLTQTKIVAEYIQHLAQNLRAEGESDRIKLLQIEVKELKAKIASTETKPGESNS